MKSKNLSTKTAFNIRSRTCGLGSYLGLGVVAFIDEVIFHQLLHWHHFYDKSTAAIGLVSDGLFHAFSFFATIGSAFLLADLHRKHGFWLKRWLGGIFLGAGTFQLYDGIIQHKFMNFTKFVTTLKYSPPMISFGTYLRRY